MTTTHDSRLTNHGAAASAWYAITAMTHHRVTVRVQLATGVECLAIVRDHPTARRPWWIEMKVKAGRLLPVAPLAPFGVARDRKAPVLWQPIDTAAWPHPLPAPVRVPPRTPGQYSPPPEDEPADETRPGDGWPYPDMRLGQRVPPVSLRECEARLLRALRTSASHETGHVGLDHRSTCADIPAEYVKIALKFAHYEAMVHGYYTPETDAVRSGWTPLRRDIEDWLYALDWISAGAGVWGMGREVLFMRAADPPWSFRAAAEHLSRPWRRIPVQTAHAAYGRVICKSYQRATGGSAP